MLTPTLAEATPRVGYLAPTDYRQVMDRLIDWVAFTPLQNVTGDPAISLPLAQSAEGMPVGMMLAAEIGQEALLLELAYELEEARPRARIQAADSRSQSEPSFSSIRLNSRCCAAVSLARMRASALPTAASARFSSVRP